MNNDKQPFWRKIFSGSGWALFTMFVWQMVEEGLENIIAFALSSALTIFLTKTLSTLAIITATQGIKVSIKRFLTPLIKTLTYKEGNDKMSKIKQFFVWIWCNKKSLGGVCSSAVIALSGTGVIDVNALPALYIGSFNITPLVYYACLIVLTIIGITGKGFERIQVFFERVGLLKQQKEANAIIKEAKKELANEEKLANQTQTEQEKAKAKADAEAKAKAEKEQADALHRAKIEEAKIKLLAEQQAKTEIQNEQN